MDFGLSISQATQGQPFHTHGPSWLGLVSGRKQWVLAPPSESFSLSGEGLKCVEGKGASIELPKGAIELVQEAGDVVYVPNDWHHATCNLSPFTERASADDCARPTQRWTCSVACAGCLGGAGPWRWIGGQVMRRRRVRRRRCWWGKCGDVDFCFWPHSMAWCRSSMYVGCVPVQGTRCRCMVQERRSCFWRSMLGSSESCSIIGLVGGHESGASQGECCRNLALRELRSAAA